MSEQAQFWSDSWEPGPSSRKGLFGNSEGVFNPRKPVKDQTLPLPPAPGSDLKSGAAARRPSNGREAGEGWRPDNSRRLQLAADALADNDELLGLLEENLLSVQSNRYNLEVYVSIAQLYRQNLEMLFGVDRMNSLVESAQRMAAQGKAKDALESLDNALGIAAKIRQQRNTALRDAAATWYKSWWPRAEEANGRRFLHELDDVKDHVPDRTVDMSYLVYRQLQLPFGEWVAAIRGTRNQYAAANHLPERKGEFDWRDMETTR
jgi:hypothetical protein